MMDFYGLLDDSPDKNTLPRGSPYQRVAYLESVFAEDIENSIDRRFHHSPFEPFLVLHEFETFVLVDPKGLGLALPHYKSEHNIGGREPEEMKEKNPIHMRVLEVISPIIKRHYTVPLL